MTDGLVAHLKAHGVLCTGREAGTYGGKGLLRMVDAFRCQRSRCR